MNIVAHIDDALTRGKSKYSLSSVLGAICEGHGGWEVSGSMSGSWLYREGTCEVLHLSGSWDNDDARAIVDAMKQDMRLHGVTVWRWAGRKGWARFLRMKGFKP